MKKVLLAFMLTCVAAVQAADRFVTFNGKEASFANAKDGHVLNIVCDAQEDEGVVMALRSLQADLKSVTGHEAQIGQQVQPQCIMVGSMQSALIRQLADKGKIDKQALQGKREKYLLQVVEKPTANVTRALVIAGSDKRGTIYGIYELSRQMGVSPWYWFADVEM